MSYPYNLLHFDVLDFDWREIKKAKRAKRAPPGFESFYQKSKKWHLCTCKDIHGNQCQAHTSKDLFGGFQDDGKTKMLEHDHLFPYFDQYIE